MSFTHMVILAIIAIIVIPPEKLPEVARQVARFFNDIRRSTSGVWDDLKKDAMLRPEDLMKPNPPFKPAPPADPNVSLSSVDATQVYQHESPPPISHGHGPESVPENLTSEENKKNES
jgi:sec-independent protein translocase protein TatB